MHATCQYLYIWLVNEYIESKFIFKRASAHFFVPGLKFSYISFSTQIILFYINHSFADSS